MKGYLKKSADVAQCFTRSGSLTVAVTTGVSFIEAAFKSGYDECHRD
jgi:hypothetical protein